MAIEPDEWLEQAIALVALGPEEATLARHLAARFGRATLHIHASVLRAAPPLPPRSWTAPTEFSFTRIAERLSELFDTTPGIVTLAPVGVVVRSLAPLVQSKLRDPAIVVVDACGRYAISLLSGHEGGANSLCLAVADFLAAEPVITTTTEAKKRRIVGVGCRRGVAGSEIALAVRAALHHAGVGIETVRWLVSVDVKRGEPGLREAAQQLSLPLRFVPSVEVERWTITDSPRVRSAVGLPAVAEPASMLAGTRTRCLMKKTVLRPGVTVAIAEESLPWSESAQAAEKTGPIAPSGPS